MKYRSLEISQAILGKTLKREEAAYCRARWKKKIKTREQTACDFLCFFFPPKQRE